MPNYLSRMKPNGANGTEYKLKDEELREVVQNMQGEVTEVDTPNSTPFLYRETPYEADRVFLDELVGADIVNNQLVPIAESSKTKTSGNLTITDNRDGSYTITGTTSTTVFVFLVATMPLTLNHKYLLLGMTNKNGVTVQDTYSGNFVSEKDTIYNRTISNRFEFGIVIQSTFDGVSTVIKPQFIDLTQMFGTTIADYAYTLETAQADSGIAWLKSHGFFTKDYYPYNAGELISVKTSGKKYFGFNLFNGETESGAYSYASSGGKNSSSGYFRSPDFIRVFPNATCYFQNNNATQTERVGFYREDKSYTGIFSQLGSSTQTYTFTTPEDCYFITFDVLGTVNDGICINISKTEGTPKNGDYVPYEEKTYDISNIDLRGIPKLVNNEIVYDGDTYESNGNVTRKYGIVDLGSLNWIVTGNTKFYTDNLLNYIRKGSSSGYGNFLLCPIYLGQEVAETARLNNMCMSVDTSGYLQIRNDNYTTGAAFKTAMSGVYLIYELATPTTETADQYTNPQICDKDGTEEFIDNRTVPVPVGHNSTYANLPSMMDGDFLNYMVNNFASKEYTDRRFDTLAMSDLTDVDLTNVADGQLLRYDSSSDKLECVNPYDIVDSYLAHVYNSTHNITGTLDMYLYANGMKRYDLYLSAPTGFPTSVSITIESDIPAKYRPSNIEGSVVGQNVEYNRESDYCLTITSELSIKFFSAYGLSTLNHLSNSYF